MLKNRFNTLDGQSDAIISPALKGISKVNIIVRNTFPYSLAKNILGTLIESWLGYTGY